MVGGCCLGSDLHSARSTALVSTLDPNSENSLRLTVTMVFHAPQWVPQLAFDPPDNIPISEFMLDEKYGRYPLLHAKPPFTCGLSGVEYSALEVRDRVDMLARGLSKDLGWQPNRGTEWDKVMGVFSVNTVRTRIYKHKMLAS